MNFKLNKILGNDGISLLLGSMPVGCIYCFKGLKAVIFVTGECDEECYYCPLSEERRKHDTIYVNEEKVDSIEDIPSIIRLLGLSSASITGGDPLVKPERVLTIIRLLKESFGDSFHIHLYTSGRYATLDMLKALEKTGLDEIRFHPVENVFLKRIELAVQNTSMDVGVEIPVIPGSANAIKRLITQLDEIGVKFINLNELEITPTNLNHLVLRGYKASVKRYPAVEGSLETAREVIEWARDRVRNLSIHFCPASYKDKVQTRNRLYRQALALSKLYEKASRQGLIVKSVIEIDGSFDKEYLEKIDVEKCDENLLCSSPDNEKLQSIVTLLKKQGIRIKNIYRVEEHPYLNNRLVVSRSIM